MIPETNKSALIIVQCTVGRCMDNLISDSYETTFTSKFVVHKLRGQQLRNNCVEKNG